jgi:hypothetical protein
MLLRDETVLSYPGPGYCYVVPLNEAIMKGSTLPNSIW